MTNQNHEDARALAEQAERGMTDTQRAAFHSAGAARKAAMRHADAPDYRSLLASSGTAVERRP